MTAPAQAHPLIPAHAPGTTLRLDDSTVELASPDGGHRVRVDDLALALWELCDGETTVEEMVDALLAVFDAGQAVIRADVERTLSALAADGLIVWQPPVTDRDGDTI